MGLTNPRERGVQCDHLVLGLHDSKAFSAKSQASSIMNEIGFSGARWEDEIHLIPIRRCSGEHRKTMWHGHNDCIRKSSVYLSNHQFL